MGPAKLVIELPPDGRTFDILNILAGDTNFHASASTMVASWSTENVFLFKTKPVIRVYPQKVRAQVTCIGRAVWSTFLPER